MKNIDFEENPIIAAVRDKSLFSKAVESECKIIFLLCSNILTLGEMIKLAHEKEKLIFVHMDFAEGIGRDGAGVEVLSVMGADGIITTRASIIKLAREKGIMSVQRFFIVDSQSIDTAVDSAKHSLPDMAEIMPGVVPKVISKLKEKLKIPFIAGGLIEDKSDVISALSAGASAVSTAKAELWIL